MGTPYGSAGGVAMRFCIGCSRQEVVVRGDFELASGDVHGLRPGGRIDDDLTGARVEFNVVAGGEKGPKATDVRLA